MRHEQAPTKRSVESPTHDVEYDHPAFGCVTVTNWTGGGRGVRLFGSDLGHSSGITLTFHEAAMLRGLSVDRHMPGKILLEVDMSESQWARFVASSGNGSGTPVTVKAKRTGGIEQPPQIAAPELSKKELHGEEMADALRRTLSVAQDVTNAIGALVGSPGSVSKTTLRELHRKLENAVGHLPGTTQFIYDQFAESTERVAEDAKLEVESFVDDMATRLGMDQLRQMAPRLAHSTE